MIWPRSLYVFLRDMFAYPTPADVHIFQTMRDTTRQRQIRVCRAEEAANVRTYYNLDRDDLALWDIDWHEWAAAEQRKKGRSGA